MMKKFFIALCTAVALLTLSASAAEIRPNIVLILCDDLGYGDVQCLNPEHGKIKTPHIDKIASQGMVFTDAHSGSSVCTPTRYGLLTGRYSWRTRLQRGVVQGFKPCLIAPDRLTVAGLLKKQDYATAIIGKWHLDFQYQDPATGAILPKKGRPPIGATIPDGPVHRGFDYFHGFHHARHMDTIIENDKVILRDDEINMLPRLTEKSVEYIEERATSPDQPFFLYVPLGSPHSPHVPTKEWQGKSGLGVYGDFVMQTDATVGAIMDALEKNGFSDNTLLIFTSDNGCSRRSAEVSNLREKGHYVSAQYRGSKADIWEGGHRVPFIVRWPGKVEPDSCCEQLITLVDLFATVSEITGEKAPGMAEDSVSFLPALSGQPIVSTRKGVIHHSVSGHFAYRQGKWKLLLARGSGGWSAPQERKVGTDAPQAQLYDMENDPGEQNNLYLSHPEVAQRLLADLTADIQSGRSTDGPVAKNDVADIRLWKSGQPGSQAQNAKTRRRAKRQQQ
ncbi:MAG: arylsulfatase [Kiritimatiellae bacterium]|jgi:arylsulfatase A|nr:arylsulfatase [Kiritimatiellia bacterium]